MQIRLTIFDFLFDNPIIKREWRSRFRDPRTFVLMFVFCLGLSWLLYRSYNAALENPDKQISLWKQFVWLLTASLLFISPALTASAISSERETKLFEGLQLSPLDPLRIAFGKWSSGLLFAIALFFCVLPVGAWASVMNAVSPAQIFGVACWLLLVLVFGSSIGLASSAWSRATQYAFRSVYSLMIAWFIGSFTAAMAAGDLFFRGLGAVPMWMMYWGRTNPVVAAIDIVDPSPFEPRWPVCVTFLLLVSVLSLVSAVIGASRRFEEPVRWHNRVDEKKSFLKKAAETSENEGEVLQRKAPRSIYEVPIARFLRFSNPVLGREVRSIFRFPPPPRGVIIVQTMLAIPVVFLYGVMYYWSFTKPESRGTIFWGVAVTGLCVSVISCALMGASALARERHENTWEALRLSMLTNREILLGKVGAAFGACLVLSLPAWPLMLACIRYPTFALPDKSPDDMILPFQFGAVVLIWLGSMTLSLLLGMLIGWRSQKATQAAGFVMGVQLGLVCLGPIILRTLPESDAAVWVVGVTNPYLAIMHSASITPAFKWLATGLPFFLLNITVCIVLWNLLLRQISKTNKHDK